MAGITDGKFALKLIPYGFDMVTIGGYNIDAPTITAGEKIVERGRKEFLISKENIIETIENEANLIKDKSPNPNIKISVNLRAKSSDPIIEISKIKDIDIVEVNCHCRQEEFLKIECGQNMLKNPQYLDEFLKQIKKKAKSEVSTKIRANVNGTNIVKIAKIVEESKLDYIHIDAMNPGVNSCDLEIIKKIASTINPKKLFIIGNNSITSINKAKKMIDAGAWGISIGRAAINGKLNFDLNNFNIEKYRKNIN